MKKLSLLILSLFIYNMSNAQGQVVDRHPASQIFAIDYQSGQEIQVAGDQAILFKDALIDLVAATPQSRHILRMVNVFAHIEEILYPRRDSSKVTLQEWSHGPCSISRITQWHEVKIASRTEESFASQECDSRYYRTPASWRAY